MTSPLTTPTDVLALVISTLESCMPGVWIGDTLPDHKELAANLPVVRVDLLPGDETVPFGGPTGPLVDEVVLDIDVLARSRAAALPVADLVRRVLHAMPTMTGTGVVYVDCPPMSTRPDVNAHVRKLGVDAVIRVAHHS